jgi:predicted nucleic acid-binding protein
VTVFADSSAIVKLYANETGYQAVRAVPAFIVSAVARVEVPAALWRKVRMGELDVTAATLLCTAFENDWYGAASLFIPVGAVAPVLDEAAVLAATHGLRAYDAIQLASASAARRADPQITVFACFDAGLLVAGQKEGFTAFDA